MFPTRSLIPRFLSIYGLSPARKRFLAELSSLAAGGGWSMAALCAVVSSSVRIEREVSCQTGRKPGLSQQGREWPLMRFERFLKTPLSPSTSRRRCLKTSLLFFFSPAIKEVSSRCRSFWSHSLHRECITGDHHFQELSNCMSYPSRRLG